MARRLLGAALVGTALVTVSGCARAVPMDAAPSAADPACAQVMVALPAALNELERRETTAQATAAWLLPDERTDTAVTLTCGVTPPEPSTDPCLTMGEVDWVATEHEGRVWYTTYGRSPAVRISIPQDRQDGTDVALSTIAPSLASIPATRSCS